MEIKICEGAVGEGSGAVCYPTAEFGMSGRPGKFCPMEKNKEPTPGEAFRAIHPKN